MKTPSKQAIIEVASMSGSRDILYSNVATENDHTVQICTTKVDLHLSKSNTEEHVREVEHFGIEAR